MCDAELLDAVVSGNEALELFRTGEVAVHFGLEGFAAGRAATEDGPLASPGGRVEVEPRPDDQAGVDLDERLE